jgi:serine/threonine protein kinase
MSDLIGQQWGNYRLIHLLGQGGFAEVYQGEHLRLKMFAAIKILHTHLSEEGIEAFQREAQVIAELVHPHIVRLLDFDVKEGIPFLVLDYASNGSLRQHHPRGTRLPLSQTVNYIQQVASALQYAHDRKIIHRDVKPENMLLGSDGSILLSDFGIATIAHSTSSMSTQTSMGTISYMAPEQIQSHPRPASDQYALAIVVYQWLTGELPFQGGKLAET